MKEKESILTEIASGAGNILDSARDSVAGLFSSSKDPENIINIMHYYCIPDPVNVGEYLINTRRELSEDIDEKSLPQKRVFHVHKEEAISKIRESMIEMDTEKMRGEHEKDSFSGDSLVNIANHIDKANEKISGGVLIAGAATCLFNPVIGVAIITKSLIPSIGAKVASELLGGSGNSINKWSKDKIDIKVDETVKAAHKDNQPIIEPNIILYKIDKALNDRAYNPFCETSELDSDTLLTVPMIKDVYSDYLGSGFFERSTLSKLLIKYLNHLFLQYEILQDQ